MTQQIDGLLLLGSTMRLTRLIVADDLGKWFIHAPAQKWAAENEYFQTGWRHKLIEGLECPFCVGFWIGALNLTALAVSKDRRFLSAAWRFVATSLTLNEAAAHLGVRLGDTASME